MKLKEIAQLANVSTTTVSRVINGKTHCASENVRRRIWEIVHESGYVPNPTARSLQAIKALHSADGLINFSCLFTRIENHRQDSFFSAIYDSIQNCVFQKSGNIVYSVSLAKASGDDMIRLFENVSNIDGYFILGKFNDGHKTFIDSLGKNLVYVSLNPMNVPIDQVFCNGFDMAFCAVDHLYTLNHRRIGYVGETTDEVRYSGFLAAAKHYGCQYENWTQECELSISAGYSNVLALLKKKQRLPTALFCCSDNVAFGAIRAIQESGLKVPGDISIISVDNIDMAQHITPSLTCINVPKEELGRVATSILISRIKQEHQLPLKVELPFNIVVRDSCAQIIPD